MTLTLEQTEYLETTINLLKPSEPEKILAKIHSRDNYIGKFTFEYMISGVLKSNYNIFGEKGYVNYALYKSKNDIIYCVQMSFFQDRYKITDYAIIEDGEIFDKYY